MSEISKNVSGEFLHSEGMFEPWTDEEKWQEVDDALSQFVPHYPPNISNIESQSTKSSCDYLGLSPLSEADTKGKKGKAAAGFNDSGLTEDGLPLPRVHIENQDIDGLKFRRQWSLQQAAVKAQLQEEEEGAAGNKESGESVAPGGADSVVADEDHLDQSVDMTLNIPSTAPAVNLNEPEGPEFDPLMCSAFRLVAQFGRSFSNSGKIPLNKSQGDGTEGALEKGGIPFLWNAIYPQLPCGTPCYNPAGKYCVKLFVGE